MPLLLWEKAGGHRLEGVRFVTARLSLALALGLVPVLWLMAMPGWPMNHESLRLFRRMGVFAGQWRLHRLLPVWSSTAFGGLGSPSPIIYHKVFNVLSTALWLLTGAPKTAICLAVVLVMATACLGVFRATRVLLGRPDLAIEAAAGLLLAFATYTTTDWLTRGAMAEFCALAGVAWLFAWCLTLIREGRFSPWIGPLMAAICLSHAAIGLCCALPIGLALLTAAPRWRPVWPAWCRAGAISAAWAAALLSPVLVASRPFAAWSNIVILPRGMAAGGNYVALGRLLYEPVWHWGDAPFDLTLQLDPLLLTCGTAALALVCVTRRRRAEGFFLLATIAAAFALQSDLARPLYRVVPVLYWLQFTFRLQTFAVIALALCGVLVLDALRPRLGRRGIALLLLPLALAMSAGKPWLGVHPAALFYTGAQINAALDSEADAPESIEYRPRTGATPPQAAIAPCMGQPLGDMSQESTQARFTLACGRAGAVLPVYLAPGMTLRVNGAPIRPYRTCDDARLRVQAPAQGMAELIYPTFIGALLTSFDFAGDTDSTCAP
jgi:hypothetical protein